jgi:hypothetical protein
MNNDRVQDMITKASPWLQRIRGWIDPLVRRLCQNTERRDQTRRERIAAWRAVVDRDDFEPQQFAQSDAYATLCGHLPEGLQQEIDKWRNPMMIMMPPRSGRFSAQSRLLEEIARKERDWGLI